ncbi:MAG TPA: DUF885 domain-containing protein [Sphingomonadaceae bacterium]|nr:DUF885 domain-containing protein [Sphingomonadaceae bacterium]
MRRSLPLLLLVSAASLAGLTVSTPAMAQASATAVAAQSESERLHAWFEEKYEESLMTSPLSLTALGRKERYGELDDLSIEEADRQLAWYAATVEELEREFDYDALGPEDQLSYDLWKYDLEGDREGVKWRGNAYIFTQMQGVHGQLPSYMISLHRVDTEADMQAYISRINQFDRALSQLLARAEENAAHGVRPPYFAYDIVIDELGKLVSGAPFDDGPDSAIFEDGKAKIVALVDKGEIDQARADSLEAELRQALLTSYKPGYEKVLAFMTADRANVPEVASGVSSLPDGLAYYQYRLNDWTTTDLTADEIHEIGLAEVARLLGEMEAIKEKVGFEGTLQEFFDHLREGDFNYYPDTDEGRQAYIDDATAAIENIKAKLPDFFGILPKAGLEVRRVEPFREQDGAAQHYRAGTPDGSRPGIYYAHLSDMTAMPKSMLEVIAYHEGLPGHHMQISIAQELEGVPTFQTQAGYGAYAEGWGLYSEWLAREIPGTYADPYSEFGRLASEMWRAVRLVVDTGMHAKGWSEQRAIDYFASNMADSEATITSEIRRYLVLPGQATSYKIGMLKIQQLRARAEQALGDEFDIRTFHDTVLGGGSMPLDLLERRVDTWIAAELAD